jgi:uncharacterized protein YycO
MRFHPQGNLSEVKLPNVVSSIRKPVLGEVTGCVSPTSQQISVKQQHNDNILPRGTCSIYQLNDKNQYLIHYLHVFANFLENASYFH